MSPYASRVRPVLSDAQKKYRGRGPSKYDPEYHPQKVNKLALLGCTNVRIAEFLDISVECLDQWLRKHPQLKRAMENGRIGADADVASSLYQRAKGYDLATEKVFCTKEGEIVRADTVTHFPADVGAAKHWLAVRQPDTWREKSDESVIPKLEFDFSLSIGANNGQKPVIIEGHASDGAREVGSNAAVSNGAVPSASSNGAGGSSAEGEIQSTLDVSEATGGDVLSEGLLGAELSIQLDRSFDEEREDD